MSDLFSEFTLREVLTSSIKVHKMRFLDLGNL